jgi:hypothetical protein
MRPETSLAAVIVAIIFIVAAATAPSASAAPADDACTLLTQAQVTAAVGVPVGSGSHVTPTYLKTCTWAPSSGPTKDVKSVTLSFQAADAYETGKKLMEQTAARMKEQNDKDAAPMANASATGIGDDAYYTSMGSTYTGLMVKKGNIAFKVAMYGDFPTEKKKAVEKTLALQALSKL